MLIDKSHIRWSLISAGILLVATGSYVVYVSRSVTGPSGGSIMGLLYGIIGSLMMIFAALLAARRRVPTLRCGSGQFWLRGHLWIGTLSFFLILFHSGFQFGSVLETALMVVFIVVVASGFYGLALQQVLPRLMTSRLPLETFGQQIPFICRRLQAESDLLVAEMCGKLDCDPEDINDAAYNLADSLGKLRNGKEGEDFQKFIAATYAPAAGQTEAAAATAPAAGSAESPAAPATDGKGDKTAAAAERPLSKIEMARAAAAKKKAETNGDSGENADGAERPMSKIEMARAAAAKRKAAAGDASPEPAAAAKPAMSKIEMARASAAKRKAAAASGAAASEPKEDAQPAMSKLDMMRAQAAAKKAAQPPEQEPQSAAEPAAAKPAMSKIEMARASAAKRKAAAGEDAAPESKGDAKPAMSKIEMAHASAAKRKAAAESGDAASEPKAAAKPAMSKLDRLRAQAAAKKSPQQEPQPAAEPAPVDDADADIADADNAVVAVLCPKCNKELVLPDRSFLGRFGRCPQCTNKFVLQLPEPAMPEPVMAAVAVAEPAAKNKPLSKIEQMRAAAGKKAAPKAASVARKTPQPKPKAAAQAPAVPESIPRTEILKRFYLANVRPFLSHEWTGSRGSMQALVTPQMFAQTRNSLPAPLHPLLGQLQTFCDERRQFALQKRLHRLLHSWLMLHVPVSVALLVLFVIHVVVALRVIPWRL